MQGHNIHQNKYVVENKHEFVIGGDQEMTQYVQEAVEKRLARLPLITPFVDWKTTTYQIDLK